MLAAGVAGYSLLLFILAAGLARGIRYFGLALLVRLFGDRVLAWWQDHNTLAGLLATVILLAVVVSLFYR